MHLCDHCCGLQQCCHHADKRHTNLLLSYPCTFGGECSCSTSSGGRVSGGSDQAAFPLSSPRAHVCNSHQGMNYMVIKETHRTFMVVHGACRSNASMLWLFGIMKTLQCFWNVQQPQNIKNKAVYKLQYINFFTVTTACVSWHAWLDFSRKYGVTVKLNIIFFLICFLTKYGIDFSDYIRNLCTNWCVSLCWRLDFGFGWTFDRPYHIPTQ